MWVVLYLVNDPSTLRIVLSRCWWFVYYVDLSWICPFRTSIRHPCGMVCLFGLYSSPLGGDPSNLRTYFARPFRILRHPHRMILFIVVFHARPFLDCIRHLCREIRPLCGLLSVHVGLPVGLLVGWSVHLVDFILYPSNLWTSSGHPCRMIVHFVDFKWSTFWVIRPPCGLYFVSAHLVGKL